MVTKERPVCPACKSSVIYVRTNGDIVCRRCGKITTKAS
jgi:transcription initiation factor TFIIIB Brf1 subunit/transcription initiation factor TFIIB